MSYPLPDMVKGVEWAFEIPIPHPSPCPVEAKEGHGGSREKTGVRRRTWPRVHYGPLKFLSAEVGTWDDCTETSDSGWG